MINSPTKHMPLGNSCRLIPLLSPMQPQDISIFLSYSQDAINRLPKAIAQSLRKYGFDVLLDEDYFSRYNPPSQKIIEEIQSCNHFLCLITPATLRNGFGMHEDRMPNELKIARENDKQIIMLLGYDKQRDTGWGWSMDRHLPENPTFCDIPIENFDESIFQLVQIIVDNKDLTHKSFKVNQKQLKAEYLIDRALTEQYESILYNKTIGNPLAHINEAIELDPTYADGYYQRAEKIYRSRNWHQRLDEILIDYSKAIELDPTNPRYFDGRARIYERKQNYQKALQDYTTAIELAPHSNISYPSRAYVYKNIKQLGLAIEDFTLALKLYPHQAHLWEKRGILYREVGKFELAISDLTNAINRKGRWQYYLFRGIIYEELGMMSEAKRDWTTARKLSPKEDNVVVQHASIYRARGMYHQAIEVLENYLKNDPENERVIKLKNGITSKLESL